MCLNQLSEDERKKFLTLKFHDILRDGEMESVLKSILYIRLLNTNDNEFSDMGQEFCSRFSLFFTPVDCEICKAEKVLYDARSMGP